VLARIIEPVSKLDSIRVLEEAGVHDLSELVRERLYLYFGHAGPVTLSWKAWAAAPVPVSRWRRLRRLV
jgi:hypothetical protein